MPAACGSPTVSPRLSASARADNTDTTDTTDATHTIHTTDTTDTNTADTAGRRTDGASTGPRRGAPVRFRSGRVPLSAISGGLRRVIGIFSFGARQLQLAHDLYIQLELDRVEAVHHRRATTAWGTNQSLQQTRTRDHLKRLHAKYFETASSDSSSLVCVPHSTNAKLFYLARPASVSCCFTCALSHRIRSDLTLSLRPQRSVCGPHSS